MAKHTHGTKDACCDDCAKTGGCCAGDEKKRAELARAYGQTVAASGMPRRNPSGGTIAAGAVGVALLAAGVGGLAWYFTSRPAATTA
jgi:hypothetical protein